MRARARVAVHPPIAGRGRAGVEIAYDRAETARATFDGLFERMNGAPPR